MALLFFLFTEGMIIIKKNTYLNADKQIEELEIEKNRLNDLEKKLTEYRNFGSDYKKFKNETFIKYNDFSTFRNNLQQLLSKYNFKKSSFNFTGRDILKEFVRVSLSVKLVGQYGALKRFIFDISKWDKIMYLSSIKLQKMKSSVSGNFSMEVYFVK